MKVIRVENPDLGINQAQVCILYSNLSTNVVYPSYIQKSGLLISIAAIFERRRMP